VAEPTLRGQGVAGRDVLQVQGGVAQPLRDQLAEEVPVAVHFDGAPFAVMMLTPRDLDDFAYGFALTERGIAPADIVAVATRERLEGIELDVTTRQPAPLPAQARAMPGRSGCGICGSRELEDVVRRPARVGPGVPPSTAALEVAMASLHGQQPLNAATGAVHAAAWCGHDGRVGCVREDVGRDNALDKLVGAMLREGLSTADGFALVTSRASYEMVTKAALAGIRTLVALSAPTALAVDLANACGLTLVGFARPGRHVVYAGTGSGSLPAGSEPDPVPDAGGLG
jgi:FdhD protein